MLVRTCNYCCAAGYIGGITSRLIERIREHQLVLLEKGLNNGICGVSTANMVERRHLETSIVRLELYK